MSTKSKGTLSHVEFFKVTEVAKTNRDGITQTHCWRDAAEFLRKKCHEQGLDLPVSEHSVADICKLLGIELTKQRIPGKRRAEATYRDELEILIRAVGRLYEKLGEPLTPGLERLLAIARRETSVAKEAKK